MKQDVGPQSINHYGQLPAVTVSFNLKPGFALGDVVAQDQTTSPSETLPPIDQRHASRARPRRSRARSATCWLLLMVAILVVYIVLGILYESYIHPMTILSGLAVGRASARC